MAQQFVNQPAPPSASDNMEALFLNLAENVAYRRAKQNMKVAQKQDLELKMAAGLIPKTEITVTDEGFQFAGEDSPMDQSAAREAFYRAVGGLDPRDDRSQQGFTQVREQMLPGQAEQFAAQVAQAQGAADKALPPDLDAMQRGNFAVASALAGNVGAAKPGSMPNPTLPQPPGSTPTPTPVPSPTPSPSGMGSGAGAIGAQASVPPPPPPTPSGLGAMMAQKVGQAKPVSASQIVQPAAPAGAALTPPPTTSSSSSAAQKWKGVGKINVSMDRGGFETEMANVSEKTTMVQNAQIDEIKRSIPKLAGLAALETYGNQIMATRGYNAGVPEQNTFGTLLKQRVADLERWEKASTGSGVAQTLEKQTPFKTKVEGSKIGLDVMQSEEMQSKISMGNTSIKQPGGGAVPPKQASLPSSRAGTNTNISFNVGTRDLTARVSGLAFQTDQSIGFNDGTAIANLLESKVNTNNKAGLGNYSIEKLNSSGKPITGNQQPQIIKIKTPSGVITMTYDMGLQQSGNAQKGIRTHGWNVVAPAGLNIDELEMFAGHQLGGI